MIRDFFEKYCFHMKMKIIKQVVENKETLTKQMLEDKREATKLGMTVEEMYNMYNEINNISDEDSGYYPEWPIDYLIDNYMDECSEESMY
jgi:hypothetical protein